MEYNFNNSMMSVREKSILKIQCSKLRLLQMIKIKKIVNDMTVALLSFKFLTYRWHIKNDDGKSEDNWIYCNNEKKNDRVGR